MTLQESDFSRYFVAIHGYPPFPWQLALLNHVLVTGKWPGTIAAPTASGKTSVLDIALFVLALGAGLPPESRPPRRIALTVDRRLVVDEAYDRGTMIRDKLSSAEKGILKLVADRLLSLGGSSPLEVIRLRGGIPREEFWTPNPLQPLICLSTVDQVGSRLLFRGYGISEFSRSIHAGLLAHDTILFLDEAHLSQAFEDTLDGIGKMQEDRWQEVTLPGALQVVSMTATPRKQNDTSRTSAQSEVFTLSSKDHLNPILSKRLGAVKRTELLDTSKTLQEWTLPGWARVFAHKGITMLKKIQNTGTECPVLGIVVNRVATARAIFQLLTGKPEWDSLLLIGRSRPLDRDRLLAEYLPRMRAGRGPHDNPRPLIVVATQTIEVGANLDFDGLLTEAAALDALMQRFGREDRFGLRGISPACIVYHKEIHRKEDPVYGEAIQHAWKWLQRNAVKEGKGRKALQLLDMGIDAVSGYPGKDDPLLRSPRKDAPLLLPAHLDLLVQTSPAPCPDPAVEVFLHGRDTDRAEVQVIWRGDLPVPLDPERLSDLIAIVGAIPPMNEEALSLPIGTVRRWLEGEADYPMSDCEGTAARNVRGKTVVEGQTAIQWRGMDNSRFKTARDLAPGDTLIVPCAYGGIDAYGWNPESKKASDHGGQAWTRRMGQSVLRCHPALMASWLVPEAPEEALPQLVTSLKESMQAFPETGLSEVADGFLALALKNLWLDGPSRDIMMLLKNETARVTPYPFFEGESCPGFMLFGTKTPLFAGGEDDRASLSKPVPLLDHCAGVGTKAARFATELGLPQTLVKDIGIAGTLHDIGKSDPRFQAWLRQTTLFLSGSNNVLLAKSGLNRFDLSEIRSSRQASGYPRGARHESASVGLLETHPGELLAETCDADLVIHLVGTHHGRGRAFMPVVDDPGQDLAFERGGNTLTLSLPYRLETLNSGWTDRFWSLHKRYGWWGLAYLEGILRLADQEQSREEMNP